ncbi:MAG: hypothetical protein ACLT98_07745 [Eggerthellaceae bacterium]
MTVERRRRTRTRTTSARVHRVLATRGVFLRMRLARPVRHVRVALTVTVPKFVEKKNVTKIAID